MRSGPLDVRDETSNVVLSLTFGSSFQGGRGGMSVDSQVSVIRRRDGGSEKTVAGWTVCRSIVVAFWVVIVKCVEWIRCSIVCLHHWGRL